MVVNHFDCSSAFAFNEAKRNVYAFGTSRTVITASIDILVAHAMDAVVI